MKPIWHRKTKTRWWLGRQEFEVIRDITARGLRYCVCEKVADEGGLEWMVRVTQTKTLEKAQRIAEVAWRLKGKKQHQ